jgi:hypothetical protein
MKIFASLFILIFSVSCACNNLWCLQKVETDFLCYNSSRLSFHSPQNFCGINLEFMRGEFGIVGFISICSLEIPVLPDSHESLVVILADEKKYCFACRRLAGAQRLLLPPEATELMIDLLNNGTTIYIAMEGFGSEIPACNFSKKYREFSRVPCV